MTFRQLTGLAGLAFVGAVVAANVAVASTAPPRGAVPIATVVDYYAVHGGAAAVAVAISPLAWVALALFGAGLVTVIRPHEREHQEGWSLLGLVGVAMQNTLFAGVVGTQAALVALATSPEPAPAGMAALWGLHNALFALNGTSLALALAGFSIGARRAGLIPAWHGAVGLAGAALTLTGTLEAAGVAGAGLLEFAGFGLWLVWILAWAVRLLARAPRPVAPAAVVAPAAP